MPDFDQTYDMGVQKHWQDSDLFADNPPLHRGFEPAPNPAPGPPPPKQSYMPPPGVMPPADSYQQAPQVPPPMPPPPGRVVSPHSLPSWQPGTMASFGAMPGMQQGPLSPILSLIAGGVVGYALAGWKGAAGGALMIMGANNLGLAGTEQPGMHMGVAAVGLGLGGYILYKSSKGTSLVPNPPKWLIKK